MFTGIVQNIGKVVTLDTADSNIKIGIQCDFAFFESLTVGASVACAGACLTVVDIQEDIMFFEVIPETQSCTTLGFLRVGDRIHIERSATFETEIGGHVVSGHVDGCGSIEAVEEAQDGTFKLQISVDADLMKYVFKKGFIAVDGVSLTVQGVDKKLSSFEVHLIPETLRRTRFADVAKGERVHIECDKMTQAVVDTTERVLQANTNI